MFFRSTRHSRAGPSHASASRLAFASSVPLLHPESDSQARTKAVPFHGAPQLAKGARNGVPRGKIQIPHR